MTLREVAGRFDGAKVRGNHCTAKCPCHDDKTASLSIDQKTGSDGRDRIFLHDHAGCDTDAILAAVGLTTRDLIVNPDPNWQPKGRGNGKAAGRRSGAGSGSRRAGAGTGGNGNEQGDSDDDMQRPDDPGVDPGRGGGRDGGGSGDRDHPGAQAPVEVSGADGSGAGGSGAGSGDAEKEPALEIDWDNPDRVYSYTDENGTEIFQVVRYHYKNGPGKSFRQRMRPTEEMRKDPAVKISRDGWVHRVPEEVRIRALYRMPRVMAAIRDGKPVYVVEGEKDVETLERLGCTATCNAGGAGKWRNEYSRILQGADMIILPDNDPRNNRGGYPGQDHAYDVAMKSLATAKRIRIVNLKEACPELPEKGDVSDLMQIMGDVRGMDALQKQIGATKDFDLRMVPFWLTPEEQAERLYGAVTGYGVVDGCIIQYQGDGAQKPLCDFVVIPREEKILDNGVEQKRMFVLDGWNQSGKKLRRISISGSELDGMGWVTGQWGYDAAIVPGSTTKQKVAWCIKKVGQMTSKQVTEYNHTGWRLIDGKWAFLYHGGAIGAEGVTVDLGDKLTTYRLDGGRRAEFERMDYGEAARKSLQILDITRRSTAIALLGTMFLAPLREWMAQTDIAPSYCLFLYGKTQTKKSTLAGLAMAHFGNFHGKNAPANFKSTGNSVEEMSFTCKDLPFWVDDFHPVGSPQEKRQMNATAQRVARAFGDGAARTRMRADGTLQISKPPRSIGIITGEDLPDVGASGLARFYIVDVGKNDMEAAVDDGRLTALQEDARKGWLQRDMRGYIEWLSRHTAQLPEYLHKNFVKYRDTARIMDSGEQARAPEAIACIMLGYNMMLSYYQHLRIITREEGDAMFTEAMRDLVQSSKAQSREMESEKPTRIFLDTLSEMIATRRVWVKDLIAADEKGPYASDNMVGYRDNEYYYLLPNMAYKEVSRVCREEGREFPVSLKALYKQLREEEILIGVKEGESPAKPKTIDGRSVRVLRLQAKYLDGDERDRQMEMDMNAVDVETPFDAKT